MTNKLQHLRFKVLCGDYLIILVLHGMFISHVCLFKIHVTVAWFSGLYSRPNLNWTQCNIIYFVKIDGCCIYQ